MIETRFKKTEIGEIPEDWEIHTIREYLTLLTDYDANGSFADMADNVQTQNGYGYAWYVRATDLEQNISLDKVKYVDAKSYNFLKKSSLYGGELLIAKRGDIGKVYLFTMKTDRATLAPNLYLLKLKESISCNFLYRYFSSSCGQKSLKGINASTSLGAIYKEDVKDLLIPYPSVYEQQRIATALSDIDALLSTLNKKIEKKKLIKQGAMQQLLSGKKRLIGFTEPWVEKKLGETFKLIGNNTFSREHLSTVGVVSNIHYGDVLIKFHTIIDLRKVSLPKIKSKYRLEVRNALSNGDIIMADTAEDNTVGKACEVWGMTSELVEAGLHTIVLRPIERFSPMFLGYYLNSACYHDKLLPHIQGIKVSSISKTALLTTNIFVPIDLSEQTAIATILSDMDKEIEQLEAKRAKYEQVKQGMMQQLLTGKIRLID